MPDRSAKAVWEGNLASGYGHVSLESGLFNGPYSFVSRFKSGAGTNPEELIAAAHAGCFSMALSAALSADGYKVEKIETRAVVKLEDREGGAVITSIHLETKGKVDGITAEVFADYATKAKTGCPVSKALAAVESITIDALLL